MNVEYEMDNEFELVFVVGYQNFLRISYVDKLLKEISLRFRDQYKVFQFKFKFITFYRTNSKTGSKGLWPPISTDSRATLPRYLTGSRRRRNRRSRTSRRSTWTLTSSRVRRTAAGWSRSKSGKSWRRKRRRKNRTLLRPSTMMRSSGTSRNSWIKDA